MIIDRIFHKINSSKSHPYFYLSPLVYGLGNCAEEIYLGLIKAKHAKKKLVILYPFDIPFIFKYNEYSYLRKYTLIVFFSILFQVLLGILTLLSGAQIILASMHQIGSIFLIISTSILVLKNSRIN